MEADEKLTKINYNFLDNLSNNINNNLNNNLTTNNQLFLEKEELMNLIRVYDLTENYEGIIKFIFLYRNA